MDGPTVANHSDDVPFVFGFSNKTSSLIKKLLGHYSVSKEDIQTSNVVMTMFTNFAKTGYVMAVCLF